MKYLFWILQPQPSLHLGLRAISGSEHQVNVVASFRQLSATVYLTGSAMFDAMHDQESEQDSLRPSYAERGNGLLIVKFPELTLSASEVGTVVAKMRSHDAVILDLRGDPGGSKETLQSLLGGVFDTPVKIGDLVNSRSTTSIWTKPHRHRFTGKLVVLIDSQTDSAAELFARVIQLEKRGIVIGDRSAGRVMAAQQYMHQTGLDTAITYGAIVTEAEILMTDGQSLERNGVVPNKLILPTAGDLANGRDPVLAKAAEMLGVNLSAEEAGELFRYRWPDE